jgi:uncharacterized membrane protein
MEILLQNMASSNGTGKIVVSLPCVTYDCIEPVGFYKQHDIVEYCGLITVCLILSMFIYLFYVYVSIVCLCIFIVPAGTLRLLFGYPD